jgi:hypothetical protein
VLLVLTKLSSIVTETDIFGVLAFASQTDTAETNNGKKNTFLIMVSSLRATADRP